MGDLPVVGDVLQFCIVCDDVAIKACEEGVAEFDGRIDEDAVGLRMMSEVEIGFELAFVIGDHGIACLSRWKVVDLLGDLSVEVADAIRSGQEKAGSRREWGPALKWCGGGHERSEVADL